MQVYSSTLNDVKTLQAKQFGDDRGWFSEVFNRNSFQQAGLPSAFVQDNQSFSRKGVLRGLHYQLGKPQGKLRPRPLRPYLGRRRRPAPQLPRLRQVRRLPPQAALRHRPARDALDPRGLRPRIPRPLRDRRSPLQNHRLLRPRQRALHRLERPHLEHPLAARAAQPSPVREPQGRRGQPLPRGRPARQPDSPNRIITHNRQLHAREARRPPRQRPPSPVRNRSNPVPYER